MKKLLVFVFALVMCLAMIGCGNMFIGIGNFTYTKIHIDTHHYSGCFTVEKWYEATSGVEVLTEEVGSLFAAEGTYIMISGDKGCPFCDSED